VLVVELVEVEDVVAEHRELVLREAAVVVPLQQPRQPIRVASMALAAACVYPAA